MEKMPSLNPMMLVKIDNQGDFKSGEFYDIEINDDKCITISHLENQNKDFFEMVSGKTVQAKFVGKTHDDMNYFLLNITQIIRDLKLNSLL